MGALLTFGASATMLLGTCFREWKGWVFECSASRKYAALQEHVSELEVQWEEKMASLERQSRERFLKIEEEHRVALAEVGEKLRDSEAEREELPCHCAAFVSSCRTSRRDTFGAPMACSPSASLRSTLTLKRRSNATS